MKTYIKIILLIVVLAGIGVGICVLSVPKSEKIKREISNVLDGQGSAFSKVFKIQSLRTDLALAYIDEKKYDEAIMIYEDKINDLRREDEERKRLFSQKRLSTSYDLEAALYRMLALAYERKQDTVSFEKAKKKADELEALADRVKKAEPVVKVKSILD